MKCMDRCLAFGLSAVMLVSVASAQQNKRFTAEQRFVVPRQRQGPTIDGLIEADEWRHAVQIDGFDMDQRRARGYVLATDTALFFAVRSQLPDRGDLIRNVAIDNTDRLVFDDSIELWIDLNPGEKVGQSIQLITNANGNQWWRLHGRGGMESVHTWQAACESRSGIHDGHWHCEVRVPMGVLGERADIGGRGIGINLWRNWKNPWTQAFMIGSIFDRAQGNTWVVVERATPVVWFEERGDRFAGEVKMALRVFNPGAAALNLKAALRFEQSERPEVAETATLAVEAGGVAEIGLARTESGRARCRVTAEVTDAETGESYFLHQNAWNYEPRVPWEAPFQRGHFALRWRFRDFPSKNLLRVEADIRNMPANARVERVRAVLREKETGREVVSIAIDRFEGGRRELDIPLPAELEGDFELAAWAEGENIPAESIVDQIRRRRFAWEGQALGVTDEVFAPFEPVKAEGDRVSVVLREYRMGGLGLWDSVRARGQENNRAPVELLAGPARYVAVGADGAELGWTAERPELVSLAPQRAVYRARASGPAVAIESVSEIEMDGMMKVRLTLTPVAGAVPLQRLSLEIPVREEQGWLMHEIGDSLRRCYTGRVPAGEGVVWTSLETLRANEWLNAFTTYVWLGGGERGIAWFAENDKGWITAKDFERPLIWLSRHGGVVTLRVDLVNVPGVVAAPTELVFGLQASPVKPMPDDYRDKWHKYQRSGPVMPWGGMSCAWKQPWDNLWQVVDKVNESNRRNYGEPVDEQWFKDVQERHNIPLRNGEPWSKLVSHFANRLVPPDHGHEVYFEEMVVLATLPEYHVYQGEWNRGRNAPLEFLDMHDMYRRYENQYYNPAARPTFNRSYVDYTLSLMDEWLKRGVSIKWDNVSVKVSDDPWVSAAYEAADGRIQPAALTWHLRDYMRRTWNLLQHWRRAGAPRPLDFNPHVTNVLMLPWQSWATMTDDLELSPNAYASAFPRRYDPGHPFMWEFILTESAGRQVGAHATLVHDLFNAQGFPEETLGPAPGEVEKGRREWGMRLVHEIAFGHYQVTRSLLAKATRAFGYGTAAVRVFNYWDDEPAFTVDNAEVKGILLARPGDGRLVLLLQSWVPDPAVVEVSLDPRVIGFEPGVFVEDVFRRRNLRFEDGKLRAELDFPFAAGVYVIGHQAPEAEVLFRDDFESGLSFAWDYVPGYAEVSGGALRFLENRASWTGVPRVFNWLELPDFAAGELSFSFQIGQVPAGNEGVLTARFPGDGIEWSRHGLSHSNVAGGIVLEVAANPGKGFVYTVKHQADNKWRTLGAATGGTLDGAVHQVRITFADGRYQVEVDGAVVLDLDAAPVVGGNAFQLAAARNPEKVGGLFLHHVELRAAKPDPARLSASRVEAAERSREWLAAARRDPVRELLVEAFGADKAGELMILRHFNRPLEEAAELLAMFQQAESAGQRQACLVVLRELPNRQKAHVEFMKGIGQEAEQLPSFLAAREAAVKALEELKATGRDLPLEALEQTIKALK